MSGAAGTPPGAGAQAPAPLATRREWAGLALMVVPMLMLSTDLTVLFFALPTLSTDLEPSATQTLWILHVYGFLIAGFLVTMGRLSDRVGPRRLLLVGSGAFAGLSVLAAFATGPEMLIAVRALMGVAGATLMPSLFSLLRTMFQDEQQRRTAIAIMFSAFSVGGALGPLLGGALLEFFWWGSVFLINVPTMLLLVAIGPFLLPERAERTRERVDPVSVLLCVAGVLAVVYGLQELAARQEDGSGSVWSYLAILACGLLVLALFFRRQGRLSEPLLDPALLRDRRLSAPLGALLLVGVGVVGTFYLFTQYLQWVAELSPFQAGLWTLPYIVVNIAGAMAAPALATRTRPAVVVVGGLVVAALGAGLVVAVAAPGASLPLISAALAVVGLGHGAAMTIASDLIISSAPVHQAGSAAATQEVGGELGTALGIAAGGAAAMVVYRGALPGAAAPEVPQDAVRAAQSSVHEGVTVAGDLPAHGPALLDAVHEAVAQGMRVYAGVGAVLIALAALLVAVVLARRRGDGPGEPNGDGVADPAAEGAKAGSAVGAEAPAAQGVAGSSGEASG